MERSTMTRKITSSFDVRDPVLVLAAIAAGAQPGWSEDLFTEPLGPGTRYGVTAIAVDPRDSEVLFAGSDQGGLYASRDGGASWRTIWPQGTEASVTNHVSGIEIDPGNPDVVYVAVANYVRSRKPGGIFRSADGGLTWHAANEGLPGPEVSFLEANPHLPGVVYAGVSKQIFRSLDHAKTWHRVLDAGVGALYTDPRDSRVLYAAGRGLLKSTDGGESWTSIGHGIPFDEVGILSFAVDPHDPGVLIAGTSDPSTGPDSTPGRIYRSTDEGTSWRMISQIGGGPTAMVVDPVRPGILPAGSSGKTMVPGTFLSMDGGFNWKQIHGGGARQIVASPDGAGTYFAAMRAGDTRGVVRIVIRDATAIRNTGWGSLKALLAPPPSPR